MNKCNFVQKNNKKELVPILDEVEKIAESKTSYITKRKTSPMEVKAEENLKAKSLKVFVEKYKVTTAIRTSMNQFRVQDWLTNVPLYAISTVF